MLFKEKILYSRSVSKQRNKKPSQLCYTQSQGNQEDKIWWYKTQLEADQSNAGTFQQERQLFSNEIRASTYSCDAQNICIQYPFFYPLSRTDGNKVPNSQWLSKRFRHLPHTCSGLLSPCYFQL